MKAQVQPPQTVEEYIDSFPPDVVKLLRQIRGIIKKAAPEATENISYGMPAYKLNKRPLVYYGAFKEHIGFYATPTGPAEFADELSKYKQGKGSVQFPFDQPLPLDLVKRIDEFRVEENQAKKPGTKQ